MAQLLGFLNRREFRVKRRKMNQEDHIGLFRKLKGKKCWKAWLSFASLVKQIRWPKWKVAAGQAVACMAVAAVIAAIMFSYAVLIRNIVSLMHFIG